MCVITCEMMIFLCVVIVTCIVGSQSAVTRPNIVVIVADDVGYNDVSFHGSNQIRTPNIDALAYEGIILNNYYVSPICTPTRGALMSGRHPIHTGLQHSVIFASEDYGLPLDITIMPQWFQKLGYRTHMVGKWHIGFYCNESTPTFRGFETHYGYLMGHGDYFDHITMCSKWHLGMFAKEYLPTLRGFESHYGYYQGCEDYYDHTYEADREYWGLDWRRNLQLLRNETDLYSTDLFTAEAVSLIKNHNKSEPLFLYLPHQAVHSGNTDGDPLQAPQHYVNRFPHIKNYHRKELAGMIAALDDSVGKVVATLKSTGLMDNTIIVFTTDNGGPANGFDANAASNFPLRGVKATLWEGGVRGVGFVHSPLLKTKGYVSGEMIHVCDWLPTLYRAAGGDPSNLGNLDGYDVWNVLSNKSQTPRKEMLHNIDPKQGSKGLRVGDYKILSGPVGSWDDWYPPWQDPEDTFKFHVDNTSSLRYNHELRFDKIDLNDLKYFHKSDFIQQIPKDQKSYSYFHGNKPVKIHCGKKPLNASINCQPKTSPCLYHIASDPCEYNNIADQHPDIVNKMMARLKHYEDTMVPPLNTPVDPAGNPKYHNSAWVPWVKL